jgi:hypothetical protein
MHADPEPEALLIGLVLVCGCEGLLHLRGTPNSIDGACELRQDAVAGGVGDPSTVFGDEASMASR